MDEQAKQLVGMLSKECKSTEDVQSILKALFKGTVERMLETGNGRVFGL